MPKYKLKLLIGSPTNGEPRKTQKVEGSSIMSCLKKLKRPATIMAVGTIEASCGDKKMIMHMNIPRLKRMFNKKPVFKEVIASNIMSFLK
jgi:hypothetical protein